MPSPAPPEDTDIVRRHWDQVCLAGDEVPGGVLVSELFDTVGLGDELEARGLRVPTRMNRNPRVNFVTRYGMDGAMRRSGIWESRGVDSSRVEAIGEVLRSRARDLSGLLEPQGFHTQLTLTPWPRLALAPAIECLPHMVHLEGEPPTGLPDTVRTTLGRTFVREGDTTQVAVRLLIDEEGRVLQISRERGGDRPYMAAREIIPQLRFDPPLRNGEPVRAEIVQSFRFRRGGG